MSAATTVAQARAEFLADLRRLKPGRDQFLATLDNQAQALAALLQKKRQMINDAAQGFLEVQKTALDAHIDAELLARGEE